MNLPLIGSAEGLWIWTAVLKIARLVLIYGFFIIVIVPNFSEKLGHMVGEMMNAQQQQLLAQQQLMQVCLCNT